MEKEIIYPVDPATWSRPQIKHGAYEDLLQVDLRGGILMPLAGCNFHEPEVRLHTNFLEMRYEINDAGHGYYRLLPEVGHSEDEQEAMLVLSQSTFNVLPNRNYLISALINADYDRQKVDFGGSEVNLGIWTGEGDGSIPEKRAWHSGYMNGTPSNTHGWVRWEWEFTTSDRGGPSYFWLRAFEMEGRDFKIADIQIVELPPKPLISFPKGTGVTFKGGPGNLPIRLDHAKFEQNQAVVSVTGARYTFDYKDNVILAEQLLEKQRLVSRWNFSLPLTGFEILSQTEIELVLVNDSLTIGIQCDGLVLISPQKPLQLTVENCISAPWSRLISGQLVALDTYGGFTGNPCIPLGTGRLPECQVLTPGLDFVGKINDPNFLSHAEPGWKVTWSLSPGERFGISVFPPRAFDWKKSFESQVALTSRSQPLDLYGKWANGMADIVILWDFSIRGYGMSFSPVWIPISEQAVFDHVKAIKAARMRPIIYMSPHFYYSLDGDEYIRGVREWIEKYGLEGVYMDGLPTPHWLLSYEIVRMARELIKNGDLVIHTTGQAYGGGPPLHLPDVFMPFIDTYATATVRGEWLPGDGIDWPYPRYVTSQYRVANCIGITKGDRWTVPLKDQYRVFLTYNMRAWLDYGRDKVDPYQDTFLPMLQTLRKLWEERGSQPDFYENYYLPKARELTGLETGK